MDLAALTLGAELGAGGQGRVYLATLPSGQRLALKVVEPAAEVVGDRAVFEARVQAFARPDLDRALAPFLAVTPLAAAPKPLRAQLPRAPKAAVILVTPFIEGQTLFALRALTPRQVAAALCGVAQALDRLPSGVAHGDLRAPNVFVTPAGDVVLIDPDLAHVPTPAEDLAALGRLGLALIPPEPNAIWARLRQLCEELARRDQALSLPEAIDGFAHLAVDAGASIGRLSACLAPAVERAEPAPAAQAVSAAPPPAANRLTAPWFARALAALAGAVVLSLGVKLALAHFLPPRFTVGQSVQEKPAPYGLYDKTGTVHYPEQVHPLGSGEYVAANDGFIEAGIMNSDVNRVAVLSLRKDVLWEIKDPKATFERPIYLDVKPGKYFVEVDTQIEGKGLRQDQNPVRVDYLHPYRFTLDSDTPDIEYVDPGPHRSQIVRLIRDIELDGGKSDLNPMDYDP